MIHNTYPTNCATTQTYTKPQRYALLLSLVLLLVVFFMLPVSGSKLIHLKASASMNVLYAMSGIFLLFFWRDVQMLKTTIPLLLCFGVVVVFGMLSTLFSSGAYGTWQNVRRLMIDGALMLCVYLLVRRLDSKTFLILFLGFCVAVFIQPLATIINGIMQVNFLGGFFAYIRATGFGNNQPLVYSFVLMLSFSLSIASLWLTQGKNRFLSLILMLLSVLGIIANNSRLVFIACFVALIVPFFLFNFAYKKRILLGIGISTLSIIVTIYIISANWHNRYNVHKMVANFTKVASLEPAEMGRFDVSCAPNVTLYHHSAFSYNTSLSFRPSNAIMAVDSARIFTHAPAYSALADVDYPFSLILFFDGAILCSPFSFPQDKEIRWEHSSLARISMNKSAIQAILQNPFRPNGLGFLGYTENLEKIFPKDSIHHSYILALPDRLDGYPHPHNQILSLTFELSILGLCAIGAFLYLLFFHRIKTYIRIIQASHSSHTTRYAILAHKAAGIFFITGVIFIITLSIAMLFDCLLWRWNTTYLFLLFGIILACKERLQTESIAMK